MSGRPKQQLEKDIQRLIKKQLEHDGWLVIRPITLSISGLPDLWCLKDGRTVFVEVKRPGNKPGPLQVLRHKQLREQGFDVMVLESVADVESAFKVVGKKTFTL